MHDKETEPRRSQQTTLPEVSPQSHAVQKSPRGRVNLREAVDVSLHFKIFAAFCSVMEPL